MSIIASNPVGYPVNHDATKLTRYPVAFTVNDLCQARIFRGQTRITATGGSYRGVITEGVAFRVDIDETALNTVLRCAAITVMPPQNTRWPTLLGAGGDAGV